MNHNVITVNQTATTTKATPAQVICFAEANGFDLSVLDGIEFWQVYEQALEFISENVTSEDVRYHSYDGRGNASYGDYVVSGDGLDGQMVVLNERGRVYFANLVQ